MSEASSDIGAFMAGFVIGGLVGAATALIMAPQSGAETRAQIAARGEELRLAGEQQWHDSSSQVQERARIVLDEGKTKVTDAIEKTKKHDEGSPEVEDLTQAAEESIGDEAES